MSIVSLQFGQCGNQVGNELYKTAYEDLGPPSFTPSAYLVELDDKWFSVTNCGARKARSVLIDTEEKVVSNFKFNSRTGWSYDKELVVTSKAGGSGNNWALGYYENGVELIDSILERIDSAVESCDNGPDGFLSLQGLGGGTGSGLCCFVNQALLDHYPKVSRTCASVLPFSDGDVCTQPYNTILSVSKLYDSQNALLLFSNDYLYKMCTQVLKIKSVKMSDMNRIISEQLACCLSVGRLSDLVDHLTQHPSYKVVSVRSTPHVATAHSIFEPTSSWSCLVGQLKMSLVKSELNYDLRPFSRNVTSAKHRKYKYYKCVANVVTCRGPDCCEAQMPVHDHPLNDRSMYPQWFPHAPQFMFSGNNKKFIGKNRFACLMNNSGLPRPLLEPVLDRAWTLFSHQAYLHHYSKYGLTNNEFLTSFRFFESIFKMYTDLN